MSERYQTIILPEAQQDIRAIVLYIAQELAAPQAALNLEEAFRLEIESLEEMPKRIKTVDEHPWKEEGIRRTRVKNYYIYFIVDDEQMKVKILAVIYVKRDQEEQLYERKL